MEVQRRAETVLKYEHRKQSISTINYDEAVVDVTAVDDDEDDERAYQNVCSDLTVDVTEK